MANRPTTGERREGKTDESLKEPLEQSAGLNRDPRTASPGKMPGLNKSKESKKGGPTGCERASAHGPDRLESRPRGTKPSVGIVRCETGEGKEKDSEGCPRLYTRRGHME